jgi:hypothetical protein
VNPYADSRRRQNVLPVVLRPPFRGAPSDTRILIDAPHALSRPNDTLLEDFAHFHEWNFEVIAGSGVTFDEHVIRYAAGSDAFVPLMWRRM